jgi:hypothetical protein
LATSHARIFGEKVTSQALVSYLSPHGFHRSSQPGLRVYDWCLR